MSDTRAVSAEPTLTPAENAQRRLPSLTVASNYALAGICIRDIRNERQRRRFVATFEDSFHPDCWATLNMRRTIERSKFPRYLRTFINILSRELDQHISAYGCYDYLAKTTDGFCNKLLHAHLFMSFEKEAPSPRFISIAWELYIANIQGSKIIKSTKKKSRKLVFLHRKKMIADPSPVWRSSKGKLSRTQVEVYRKGYGNNGYNESSLYTIEKHRWSADNSGCPRRGACRRECKHSKE